MEYLDNFWATYQPWADSYTLTPPPPPPPPAPTYSPMGDPIDPYTGLADVSSRFDNKINEAFDHFCGASYTFSNTVDNYGNLLEGITSFPQDYLNYMMDFYYDVKTGGPWDLKYSTHGYSYAELGNKDYAMYNGDKMQKDDFGNITFGIAAAAYGLPMEFARTGAGYYQILSGTSHLSYMTSYWDDPRDSEMIARGYAIFYSRGGCINYLNQ